MNDVDPYKTPESDIGIQKSTTSGKWKILDIPIAIVFLITSYWNLSGTDPDFLFITLPLGIYYFLTAFSVFRGYRFARYLLYLNGSFILLFSAAQIYFGATVTLPALIVMGFGVISFVYGWFRYKNLTQVFTLSTELKWLALTALIFFILLVVLSFLSPPRNLSAPVQIN